MKQTNYADVITGTHYKGITIKASLNRMKQELGDPQVYGSGDSKVQYTWVLVKQLPRAMQVITIYDCKEEAFNEHDTIKWHIGGRGCDRVGILRFLKRKYKFLEEEIIEDKEFNY